MTNVQEYAPNLIIAGVQKGGTTWLHRVLEVHENVFMTKVKELNYFNRPPRVRSSDSWKEYLEHFSDGAQAIYKYRGESTPHYLWVKDRACQYSPYRSEHNTAREINRRLGAVVQIVVILRHPVERAVSAAHHHSHGRLSGAESVWDAKPELGIIDLGFYKRHLSVWLDIFGNERLHIFLYEDLERDPLAFIREVVRRLKLSCEDRWLKECDLHKRINSRERVRMRGVESNEHYAGINGRDRERLNDLYSEDIMYVRSLLGDHIWAIS